MSEQHLRENKFTYSSNLVIQREHGPRTDEPTGEPESLVGKINPKLMGTKAVRDQPIKSKKESTLHLGKQVQMEIEEGIGMPTYENLLYIPKTKDNRLHYEKLLSIVYCLFQEQSQDIIKSIVDEILAIMKHPEMKDSEKRQEVEAIIGKLTNELFSDIVLSSKGITDYNPEITGQAGEMQLLDIRKFNKALDFVVQMEFRKGQCNFWQPQRKLKIRVWLTLNINSFLNLLQDILHQNLQNLY